jgi:hypothetical protein
MAKTDSYYFEKYGGISIGFFSFLVTFIVGKPMYNACWDYLLSKSFDLGIGTFGFLLAVLALIVQSDTDTIRKIKERDTLYKRLILFNKRVVFISITICIYSVFAKLINDSGLLASLLMIQNLILSIFIFLLSWFVFDMYKFLKIFYKIIMNK